MHALLSILIPVYGTEDKLLDCLESICEDGVDDINVIVISDGGDLSKIQNICDRVKMNTGLNISLIAHKKNRGLFAARLTGLNAASGKYVMHLDSDDAVNAGLISLLRSKLYNLESDYKACFFNVIELDGPLQLPHDFGFSSTNTSVIADLALSRISRSLAEQWVWFVAWNKVWDRRFLLSKIEQIDDPNHLVMLEDFYLSLWTLINMKKEEKILVLQNTPGVNYFRHFGSATRKQKSVQSVRKNLYDSIFVIKSLRARMPAQMKLEFDGAFLNLYKKNFPHPKLIVRNPVSYGPIVLKAFCELPRYSLALLKQGLFSRKRYK